MRSFLDNDLYKFTMQQAVCKLYPRSVVKYEFFNRGKTHFPEGFDEDLNDAIAAMSNLAVTEGEIAFLKSACPFLDPVYLDFLRGFRLDAEQVDVELNNGNLKISIVGPWYKAIMWEVPLMAAISELYFKMLGVIPFGAEERREVLLKKARRYSKLGITYADFGTRRRYSYDNHVEVVGTLAFEPGFAGTSNVHLAHMHNLKAIGTHAHEWFMFHAAMFGYRMANRMALDNWVKVYRGDLGIALTDTFTTANFFSPNTFDIQLAKLFDGIRHDSGNPIRFLEEAIGHYEDLGIDPTTKTIVFSDGLTPGAVETIHGQVDGRIRASYGIGTNFTNDVGATPLNIVIKMTECMPENGHWRPTIKLSDEPGKHTGNPEEIELCQRVLRLK
jgi:nicotinate phosphoribosyltransferase